MHLVVVMHIVRVLSVAGAYLGLSDFYFIELNEVGEVGFAVLGLDISASPLVEQLDDVESMV